MTLVLIPEEISTEQLCSLYYFKKPLSYRCLYITIPPHCDGPGRFLWEFLGW